MFTALPPDGVGDALLHNGQGAVYYSNRWGKLCEELGLVRSISRWGNCWENALSEDFLAAMKMDLGLTRQGCRDLLTTEEVKDLVNDEIPWYNTGRIKKKSSYLTPAGFREAFFDKSPLILKIVYGRAGLAKTIPAAQRVLGAPRNSFCRITSPTAEGACHVSHFWGRV